MTIVAYTAAHGDALVAAARYALGTQFVHQGRQVGVGLDCVGLLVHALVACGQPVTDATDYGRQPQPARLLAALSQHEFCCQDMTADITLRAGMVLLFRLPLQPQHVGLCTGPQHFIHAYAPAGHVIETTLSESWQQRLAGIYERQLWHQSS